MLSPNIEDNLRFLIREVQQQLERTRQYIESPTRQLRRSLLGRDNYIDNLRTFIQRSVFSQAADPAQREYLKAIDAIAVNLERIADFCADIIDQLDHVLHHDVLEQQDFEPFFGEVSRGLSQVEQAALERDVHVALSICRAEPRLDTLFGEQFDARIEALRSGKQVETHATLLFIWHYFERMGDSLLNIGEAVISASLGEKIKIGQLWALEDSLGDVAPERTMDSVALQPLGESRSGCRIARVEDRDAQDIDGTAVIFKEGPRDKLLEEKEGIERWEQHVPGVAPKVFSYHDAGRNSALLLEYIPGQTFEQILLNGSSAEVYGALKRITDALEQIWTSTRLEEDRSTTFSEQLRKRLGDVFAVHPSFRSTQGAIGQIGVAPFEELVAQIAEIEAALRVPFSVLTHGDFNVDNVIYNQHTDTVRFIDLHRSTVTDYVQDVSVFLVSNHRLQVFDAAQRARINSAIQTFYGLAGEFADETGDRTFAARLALGLARSFATSTRFILDESFAGNMFLRARYLLERVLAAGDHLDRFVMPSEALFE